MISTSANFIAIDMKLVLVELLCNKISTCGSDEDYRNFNTYDLHGEIKYPPGSTECPEIYRALDGVRYIAETTKREEESCKVRSYI